MERERETERTGRPELFGRRSRAGPTEAESSPAEVPGIRVGALQERAVAMLDLARETRRFGRVCARARVSHSDFRQRLQTNP